MNARTFMMTSFRLLTFSITTFEQVTFSIIKKPRQWVREGKKRGEREREKLT